MDNKTASKAWVEYACRDLASADHLQSMYPVPIEIICFHCQQAVEKALKGFLIYHNMPSVPRAHDLAELCKQCMVIDPSFEELLESCADLTVYSVKMRYPSDMELEERHMVWALDFAKTALNAIFDSMKMEDG